MGRLIHSTLVPFTRKFVEQMGPAHRVNGSEHQQINVCVLRQTAARGSETVDCFVSRCPRWSNVRPEFKRLAANRWGDLSYALGESSNERKDGHLDKWTPRTTMVSATINFAIATGRLEDRSKECSEEESEEEEDSAAEEADA